jgi:hypothetical protein
MSETIVAYKGFDKDLKCRDFQYEVGKEYEEPKAKACESGFHACEQPLDVFNYYHPKDGSRFCVVEQSGKISKENGDSKVASSKIKIGAEIGILGLVKAQIEYVKARCTNEYNAEPGKPATAGAWGAATSRGSVTVGKYGVGTVRGNNVKIRGGMGAFLSIAEENENDYDIAHWKTFVIDGETYKPDTWYTLKDGQIVEVTE